MTGVRLDKVHIQGARSSPSRFHRANKLWHHNNCARTHTLVFGEHKANCDGDFRTQKLEDGTGQSIETLALVALKSSFDMLLNSHGGVSCSVSEIKRQHMSVPLLTCIASRISGLLKAR